MRDFFPGCPLVLLPHGERESKLSHVTFYKGTSPIIDFLGGSVIKNPSAKAGDAGLIPGSGRSPGE